MNLYTCMRRIGLTGLAVILCGTTWAAAELLLPSIISDNMVLQRDMPIPIWGWAEPGQTVTVTFFGKIIRTTADKEGKWIVRLPAQKASDQPQTMVIRAGKTSRVLKNILIGEVWLASGQSNMAMVVLGAKNAQQEIAAANYPRLRLFSMEKNASITPKDNVAGSWAPCSPKTVTRFSAVAYFFGRDLLQNLKIPVGLINSSWGGTAIEAWSPPAAFAAVGREKEVQSITQLLEQTRRDYPRIIKKYLNDMTRWEKATNRSDERNEGFPLGWATPNNDPKSWQDAKDHLEFDFIGAVWFRYEVEIPVAWDGKDLVLELGVIDDYDTTYVNGAEVGRTEKKVLDYWIHPRVYRVPAHDIKPGKNWIAVRVFNNFSKGRFPATGKLYLAQMADKVISLDGNWQYRVERTQQVREVAGASKPAPPILSSANINMPTVLYNSMIHPLIPYALRGVIWYQGEANVGNAAAYRRLLPAMIQSWRNAWGEGDFAFGIVQLTNYMKRDIMPTDNGWAQLREAQAMSLSVPNTGLAVTIDIGEADNIHATNKQEVGRRLALWAKAKVYGKKNPYSGPTYKDMKVEGNKIRLSFDHVDGGLVSKDNQPLTGFSIASKNGGFVWAEAKIDGKTVLVWSDKVAQPAAVRYAWANNPACNLYNQAGLPASPFRTDSPTMPTTVVP